MQEDEDEGGDGNNASGDVPSRALNAAGRALADKDHQSSGPGLQVPGAAPGGTRKRSLSRIARGAIFREVVLAKVREIKQDQARQEFEKQATERSGTSPRPGGA